MKRPVILLTCIAGSLLFNHHTSAATLNLSIETIYQDGEKSVELRTETYEAMEDFFADYRDWQIIDMNQEAITLRTTEDTVSPLVKWSGYANLDEE